MGADSHTTLGELREAIASFVAERSWQSFHTPKNLAMSIAIEAAELMELFQWHSGAEVPNPPVAQALDWEVADELADILIYCFALANRMDIDISTAVHGKMGRNAERYPIGSEPP